ncbi:CLCA_X family protein [Oceanimonas sp. CHS3-5]|uniref:CLCA_X family protein n=1 Tax=Oceanimonas sp. CHS3-5 TaxID=3068186 RepID=UPI00273F049F|nr:CLCA_X family protein [Oceanimonas sp. CHS3-5]MDP5291459.1 CLCA_X family protein [Oceanimonas sp. CHS3-5]
MAMNDRQFYRNGPDHLQGEVADFVHLRRRFDFRSIEIGRWVTRAERETAAAHFYNALCDLMLILRGPEPLISLRGTLSLQYGIGGRPGVSAHYSPATRCFSLAKNAGPGSIAHEWFHAFDHYMAGKALLGVTGATLASQAWLNNARTVPHPLNELLFACFEAVLLSEDGTRPSPQFDASARIDEQQGVLYFSRPEELCARAFEAFVQDAVIKNGFLVKGTRATREAKLGLYPQGTQRARCNAAFGRYFSTLGRALMLQQTPAD